jgi:hypothetical protein
MRAAVFATVAVVLLVAGPAAEARATAAATRFSSPRGFSMAPPRGWNVATKDDQQALADALKDRVAAARGFETDRMAVMLFDPADPNRNINVIVSPGRLPIDDADAESQYLSALRSQFGQMGFSADGLSVKRRTFGSHQALSAEYEASLPSALGLGTGRLHQWQAVFVSGRQTFIVTCTASAADFPALATDFSDALASLEFQSAGLSSLPSWAMNGLVGALLGGACGLVQLLFRQKPQPSQAPVGNV